MKDKKKTINKNAVSEATENKSEKSEDIDVQNSEVTNSEENAEKRSASKEVSGKKFEFNANTSKKRVKKIVKISAIIMAIVIILLVSLSLLNNYLKETSPKIGFTDKRDDIFYFPEDYSENIYEDIVYMNRSRDMKYDYFGEAVWVNEQNFNQQTSVAKFLYNYFQTVINGKYNEYKNYFSESFFERHSIPEKFTMQKIYDIEVSILDAEAVDGIAYQTYKVGYKIYENNGSFRADVGSEDCKPVAIRIELGSQYKITEIIPIVDE